MESESARACGPLGISFHRESVLEQAQVSVSVFLFLHVLSFPSVDGVPPTLMILAY